MSELKNFRRVVGVMLLILLGLSADAQIRTIKYGALRLPYGTYYMMSEEFKGHLGPPWPVNPYPDAPATKQADGSFLVDDRAAAAQAKLEQAAVSLVLEAAGLSSESAAMTPSYSSPSTPAYGSNVLWLEITGPPVNNQVPLTLHNTIGGDNYEIWVKTNLTDRYWVPLYRFSGDYSTNYTQVVVAADQTTNQFYRAQQADPAFYVQQQLDAIRPNGSSAGQDGLFYIVASAGSGVPPVTVSYRLSGTASNGVDYTFLTGSVSITNTAGGNFTPFYVHPLANATNFLDQTVTLTLNPGPGYLVEPGADSATLNIIANLFTVVTNLDFPVGLDYDPYTNSLIVSMNYNSGPGGGEPFNFARLFTNGVSTNLMVATNWGGVQGMIDEIKLAVVQQTNNGFAKGEMFFGTGVNGVIGKLSADGTTANLNWAVLDSNTNGVDTLIRGSLYVDQTGMFGHDLIAVTGGGASQGGGVWRINSSGQATELARITNNAKPHLEGVITLTNVVAKWGPWAGKIITGAESAVNANDLPNPLIHAVDTNGAFISFSLGIAPEDFDIIPTNQDFYFAGQQRGDDNGVIFKLSRSLFKDFVGDLLITQSGDSADLPPPKLFIVHWDPVGSNFITHSISGPPQRTMEQGTFAPINLPGQ